VLESVLWSIQMWVAFSIWIASVPGTPRMLRFWMITLAGCMSSMLRVVPDRPELAPTPRIVLLAVTSTVPEPLSMPLTRMVRAPLACAWVRKSAQLLTVTVAPPAPPVVPPPCVAQPTIPPGWGGLLVGGVEGDGDVVGDTVGDTEVVGVGVVGLGPAASVTSTSSKEPAV
jgi:hypothetical protein